MKDLRIIVIGANGNWGKAETLDQAVKNAISPERYMAYIVHKDAQVTGMGGISCPADTDAIKIADVTIPKVACHACGHDGDKFADMFSDNNNHPTCRDCAREAHLIFECEKCSGEGWIEEEVDGSPKSAQCEVCDEGYVLA